MENTKTKKYLLILLMKYFRLLAVIAALVIFFGGYFIFIKPIYVQAFKTAESISQNTKNQLEERQAFIGKMENILTSYQSVSQANKDKIDIALPADPRIEKLFTELEDMVNKNGLILSSLSIAPVAVAKPQAQTNQNINDTMAYEKTTPNNNATSSPGVTQAAGLQNPQSTPSLLKISMVLMGTDYVALKNILNTFENNLRLMDVQSVDFNIAAVRTSLEITAYYFKS